MEEQPNYYAIIPANVRYDKRLPSKAPLLFGEITALCNKRGHCWASDDYFMNLYGVSKTTIQVWLKALENRGYIKREVIYKEGSKEIDKRYIRIQQQVYPNLGIPYTEKPENPMPENRTDNNTKHNNTSINNTKTHSAANAAQCVNDSNKKDLQKDFEEVWSKYPNKKGKEQAFNHYKAWRKKSKLNTNAYLLDKLNKYLKYIVANKSWYHAMNGSTWFNGRFEDDLEVTNIRTPETKKDWFKGLND